MRERAARRPRLDAMWIERIAINRFAAFDTASVEFAPGLNVVEAPNEGGKSSLFRAIAAALFAEASSRSAETKELARWGSDALFRLELELWIGDSCFRVVKDFQSREQAVFRRGSAEPLARGKGVAEFLRGALALSDESLFLLVCGVRHEELSKVGEGESSVGERLEEILGGGWGEATPDRVAKALEEKRAELLRGVDRPANEKNWGPVKRLRTDIAALEGEEAEARETASEREGLMRAISGAGTRACALDERLAALDEKLSRAKRRVELARRRDELRGAAEEARKRIGRLGELLERRAAVRTESESLPEAIRALGADALEELARELDRERSISSDLSREKTAPARIPLVPLVIISGLITAAVVAGLLWNRSLLYAAGLGAALLIFLVVRSAAMGRPAFFREKERELGALAGKRRSWAGSRTIEDAAALLGAARGNREKLASLEIRIEETAGEPAAQAAERLERLDSDYGDLSRELRGAEEALAELEPFTLDADALLALEREMSAARSELDALRRDIAAKERSLAALPAVDGGVITERLASAREALGFTERRVAVIDAALESLEEARARLSGFLAGKLPPLAGEYLSRMTEGRYRSLFIDPVKLGVELVPAASDIASSGSAKAPERISPEALSQGARDQVYLAVRLALARLLGGTEPQPLFLDDPFVHFDPDRRRRALELICDSARSNQVILFTCDPAYRALGGRLIELAKCRLIPPAAERSGA